MKLNEYQVEAYKTAVFPEGLWVVYPTIGLSGECGEVCEKVKKVFRDKNGVFAEEDLQAISKEMGDVLWYLAAIASNLGISLDDVAEMNLKKLNSRMERGVLQGNGDDR